MGTLTWKRGQASTVYEMGGGPQVVTHTTHGTTLSNGDEITITSVDGLFFVDLNGTRGGHFPTLRDAKAAAQRTENVIAQARKETGQ